MMDSAPIISPWQEGRRGAGRSSSPTRGQEWSLLAKRLSVWKCGEWVVFGASVSLTTSAGLCSGTHVPLRGRRPGLSHKAACRCTLLPLDMQLQENTSGTLRPIPQSR